MALRRLLFSVCSVCMDRIYLVFKVISLSWKQFNSSDCIYFNYFSVAFPPGLFLGLTTP